MKQIEDYSSMENGSLNSGENKWAGYDVQEYEFGPSPGQVRSRLAHPNIILEQLSPQTYWSKEELHTFFYLI